VSEGVKYCFAWALLSESVCMALCFIQDLEQWKGLLASREEAMDSLQEVRAC
jgi:hypothetical protein